MSSFWLFLAEKKSPQQIFNDKSFDNFDTDFKKWYSNMNGSNMWKQIEKKIRYYLLDGF